jgi:hypothetical protein
MAKERTIEVFDFHGDKLLVKRDKLVGGYCRRHRGRHS